MQFAWVIRFLEISFSRRKVAWLKWFPVLFLAQPLYAETKLGDWFQSQTPKWPKEALQVLDPYLKDAPTIESHFFEQFHNRCQQTRVSYERTRGFEILDNRIIRPAFFVPTSNGECPALSCVIELPCYDVEGNDTANCSEVVNRLELRYTPVAYTFDDAGRPHPRVCGLQNVNEFRKVRTLDHADFWLQFETSAYPGMAPDPAIDDVLNNIFITNTAFSQYVDQKDQTIIWGWRVGEYAVGQTDLMIPIMHESFERYYKLNDSVRPCGSPSNPSYRWNHTYSSDYRDNFRRVFICLGDQGAQRILYASGQTDYRESQTETCPNKSGIPQTVPNLDQISTRRAQANQLLYQSLQRRLDVPCSIPGVANGNPLQTFNESPGAHVYRDPPPPFNDWQSMSPFGR